MCRPSRPTKGAVVRRFERGLGVAVDAGGVKAVSRVQGEMNLVSMARTAKTDGAQCLAKPLGDA
ncbi:hypothetical protein ACVWY3_007411 [Bradyrhizobium sp. USDA 4486]